MMVGYNRMSQLIVLASSQREPAIVSRFSLPGQPLLLSFQQYVYSQLQYQLGRGDLSQFVYTRRFIQGDKQYRKEAMTTLWQFYNDVGLFLVNNPSNCRVSVETDCDFDIPSLDLRPESVREELLLVTQADNNEQRLERIKGFVYPDIFDLCLGSEDLKQKLDSYTTVCCVLYACSTQRSISVRWSDGCKS